MNVNVNAPQNCLMHLHTQTKYNEKLNAKKRKIIKSSRISVKQENEPQTKKNYYYQRWNATHNYEINQNNKISSVKKSTCGLLFLYPVGLLHGWILFSLSVFLSHSGERVCARSRSLALKMHFLRRFGMCGAMCNVHP